MTEKGKSEEIRSVYRLEKKLSSPLVLLLFIPLIIILRSFLKHGLTGRNFLSLFLMVIILLLFSPWLTRKVEVDRRGILSATVFRKNYLSWAEMKKVTGFVFRDRAMVIILGPGRKLVITDSVSNFKHLVGYIIEHALEAEIDDDVAPILMVKGRNTRDSLFLWGAVMVMVILFLIQFSG